MLSFLSPLFLFGALVAAVPIALHLLGRRPQLRVLFPAVRLLKRAPAQETRRRRLRELVLLALRVVALVLLAGAFARPYFERPAATARRAPVVVAVDRSSSMSAPGQFRRALSIARDAIMRAAPGAPVGLLAFDDAAEVLAKPTGDRAAVLKALDQLRSGFGGTSYQTALVRGAELLGSSSGHLVVVTDMQRSGWDRRDAPIPATIDVTARDAGAPASNLAVGDVRRAANGLAAIVRNSGATRRTGRARLDIDGHPTAVTAFAVEGGGTQEISFTAGVPQTGEASVEIDDANGYAADNKAYALLDPPEPPALIAITGQGDPSRGAFYLQRALEVDSGQWFHLDTEVTDRFAAHASPSMLRKYAAVILLGTRGLTSDATSQLADYVAAGGGLLVALDDQVDPQSLDRVLNGHLAVRFDGASHGATVGLLPVDSRHPILQLLEADAFSSVHFQRVARTDAPQQAVLARFADGSAALVERRQGQGRVLLFGSDLSNRWNNLPLQPAFLPLVHQMARYLVRDRMPVREFVVSAVPPGIDHQPGVKSVPASLEAAAGANGSRAPLPRRIVVNVDPRESDVTRVTAGQFDQLIARSRDARTGQAPGTPHQAEQQQGLWRVAIVLAIIALLVEGLVGKTVRV